MRFNKFVRESGIIKQEVQNVLIIVIRLQALLEILQISHVTHLSVQAIQSGRPFSFILNELLQLSQIRVGTENLLVIVILLNLSLVVRVWNNAFRNDPLLLTSIEAKVMLGLGYNQKVEVVKYRLLFLFPISVVEIVIQPHDSLVNNLWCHVFRQGKAFRNGKLKPLSDTDPGLIHIAILGSLLALNIFELVHKR